MDPDDDGEWVRYEEADNEIGYARLLTEQAERQRDSIGVDLGALTDQYAEQSRELDALRETLAARQTAAEYSRRQCEKAEASLRVAEMLLADCANWLITAPEDAKDRDEAKRLVELREAIRKELKLT